MRSKRKRIGVIAGTVLVSAFAALIVFVSAQPVLADTGPDGDYGGANVWYTLSRTDNVDAPSNSIPIYSPTKTAMRVDATFKNNGRPASDPGGPSYINFTAGSTSYPQVYSHVSMTIPAASFTYDAGSNLYVANVNGSYVGSESLVFKLDSFGAGSYIGYSSNNNNTQFAVCQLKPLRPAVCKQ